MESGLPPKKHSNGRLSTYSSRDGEPVEKEQKKKIQIKRRDDVDDG